MISYEIKTEVAGSTITQELDLVSADIREQLMRRVMDLGEQQIRDALIKMGWTPPPA